MNKIISVFALAAMAVSVFAQSKPPKSVKCPVMRGSTVDIAKATKAKMFADYKGRRYFFCCPGCPQAFKSNPAKYAKSAQSIPTPKKNA